MMQAAAGVKRVVFVNVNVPRPWEAPDNAVLAAGVARYPGVAVLADWNALSTPHPEWFTPDQVHLEPAGAQALAALVGPERLSRPDTGEPGADTGSRRPPGVCYARAMPRFEPFTGLRYDTGRVDLSMVVCPPYDVIGPEERARLVSRHSANAVRVELPEPDHRAGLDRYDSCRQPAAAGGRTRASWSQIPPPPSTPTGWSRPDGHATNGVIGALGIDDESAAEIFPHEQTLPKAKSDRLDLLAATRANLSPIWGLSLTAGLSEIFATTAAPSAEAVDGDGVRHQLWVIDDLRPMPGRAGRRRPPPAVVLADGHHRYETARTYRQGRADDPGADLVMALVVELSRGPARGGSHPPGPLGAPRRPRPGRRVLARGSTSPGRATSTDRTTSALGESGALALLMPSGSWLLTPKDGTAEAAGSDLDSSMVALVIAELPDHELEFLNSWQDGVGGRRRRQGPGRPAPAAGVGRTDRRVGQRRAAHAPQDHLLPPQTGHRHGVPVPRPDQLAGLGLTPSGRYQAVALVPDPIRERASPSEGTGGSEAAGGSTLPGGPGRRGGRLLLVARRPRPPSTAGRPRPRSPARRRPPTPRSPPPPCR